MAFSPELGYDPDEWEECPAPDHFLALSMFTRVCLSIGTVVVSVLFFWVLETNKRRNHRKEEGETKTEQQQQQKKKKHGSEVDGQLTEWEEEEETVENKFARAAEEAALKARPERRRNSKRELSKAEEAEMFAWKAEVQRTAETRLRASEEPESEEERRRSSSSRTSAAEEENGRQMADEMGREEKQRRENCQRAEAEDDQDDQQQLAFQQRSAADEQQRRHQQQTHGKVQTVEKVPEAKTAELVVPMNDWAKTKQVIRVVQQSDDFRLSHPGATPLSTPPDGIGQIELAAHYRQMANELTQKLRKELDEMEQWEEMDSAQMAQKLQRRHRQDIAGGLEGTAASPEVRHRLARQLESHVANVVAQEMRKRASFSALAGEEEESTEQQQKMEQYQQQMAMLKTGSSGESSEDDFVKVKRQQSPTQREKIEHQSFAGTALREVMQVNVVMASSDDREHGLTPSPQMEGPATEEREEQVRVSMFEGDGGSTTADEIEYVPVILERSKCFESSPPSNEPPKQRPLGAEEAEQMLALLQEYDLSAGEVVAADPTLLAKEHQQPLWERQMSSGPMSSSAGVISLSGSTQRTTPAGSSSVPESPDSAAFGFVKIHPLAEIEDTQIGVTEEMEQQQDDGEQEEEKKVRRKEGSVKSAGTSFIVEEEMLESVAEKSEEKDKKGTQPDQEDKAVQQHQLKSRETAETGGGSSATMATSRQIGTNEAFDRPAEAALLFEDIDDKDVTYAPEIQSLEVPPDQLSQADSLNLVDEEQFSEEQQRIIITGGEEAPLDNDQQQQQQHEAEKVAEQPNEAEAPQRELTPHEEEKLQRIIDRLRRTQSPQRRRMGQTQVPQAPQFLRSYFNDESTSSLSTTSIRQSSLLSALGVTSTQEMLLRLTSLEALSEAMRKAGLESSNLIFGIDYTASNKYQGERSFGGQSLHSIDFQMDNPYQTVIKIMGRTLAPFAGHANGIPLFGFGDSSTGDWTVFSLNEGKDCETLEEVLSVYNRVTSNIDLSGPTNFAPLIYRAMEICQQRRDYHILVIIADGQVTNEKATVKAIVSACQFPLSIIVVGVGDGPWEMMRVFDESLPKRPWDNFHFVELHELIDQRADQPIESRELAFAVHSLLEIPDQYATIRKMGLLSATAFFTRPPSHSSRRSKSPKAPQGIGSTTAEDEGKETNC